MIDNLGDVQTRLYAAGLTVMEMFNDRDAFKIKVQEHIEKELQSFGLQVFNGKPWSTLIFYILSPVSYHHLHRTLIQVSTA